MYFDVEWCFSNFESRVLPMDGTGNRIYGICIKLTTTEAMKGERKWRRHLSSCLVILVRLHIITSWFICWYLWFLLFSYFLYSKAKVPNPSLEHMKRLMLLRFLLFGHGPETNERRSIHLHRSSFSCSASLNFFILFVVCLHPFLSFLFFLVSIQFYCLCIGSPQPFPLIHE